MDSSPAIPRETVPSLVFLRSEIPSSHPSSVVLGEERLGAGVAVAPDLILTAHYLVLGASRVVAHGSDGRSRSCPRIAVDHESGLALLGFEGPPLRPVRVGDSEQAQPGLPVFLLTCTDEQERKGATGHITVIGPFEAFWEYMLDRAIMTTLMNPGLAGAPLLDGDARLIGIVTLGLSAVGRFTLAIPIELFVRDREELACFEPRRSSRAWLGLYPQGFDGGLMVTGLVPGGPAQKAGLARGDMILSVEGEKVGSLRELYSAIWKKTPGEVVGLMILREGSLRSFSIRAEDRYAFYE